MKYTGFLAALLAAAAVTAGAQTTLLSDDFESYADTSAMEGVWTASQAGVITLTTAAADGAEGSSKYILVPSATAGTLSRTYTEATATAVDPVTLTAYMRAADWGNTRASVNIRDTAFSASLYVSIGTNNDTADDVFKMRILGYTIAAASPGYVLVDSGPARPVSTWTKLQISCSDTSILPIINDVQITADEVTGLTAPGLAFGSVRVGYGNSPNKDLNIDSISVVAGPLGSAVSDWDLML